MLQPPSAALLHAFAVSSIIAVSLAHLEGAIDAHVNNFDDVTFTSPHLLFPAAAPDASRCDAPGHASSGMPTPFGNLSSQTCACTARAAGPLPSTPPLQKTKATMTTMTTVAAAATTCTKMRRIGRGWRL